MTGAAPTADAAAEGEAIFRASLVQLLRAHDSFGVWRGKSDEEVLQTFVLTREQRRAIPVIGDPDPKVLWRVEIFYTAVSFAITRRAELNATPFIKVSSEGFGRALITVGRLVVLDRSLRDVHRFGFESIAALEGAGAAMLAECLQTLERFPLVARD